MDYKIEYPGPAKCIVVKTAGRMNAGDYIAMAKDILRHPGHLPGGNAIFDHEALDFSGVKREDLQEIRAFHLKKEKLIGGGKTAIIVKPGMAVEWHKLWSQGKKARVGNRVEVFEDRGKAIDWLNTHI
ncbi:MAG: hypothetical protein PHN63_04775 [Candidatus Omnitrophica bacterium]|nr:hypothetical protein [Candidatus Omnitrophota bacterium]